MADAISFDGLSISDLYTTVTKAGVSKSEASILVSSWIFENLGRTKRVFAFREPFPATDPACAVDPFAREFVHADWVDGEDTVQAGTTPGELGFNERFHQIERDIDRLGADVGQAFACLAAMRSSLAHLLEEIRSEINRVNSDLHEARGTAAAPERTPGFSGLVDFGRYQGTTTFLDKKVSVWQTEKGTFVLPALETVGVDVVAGPRVTGAANLDKYLVEKPDIRGRFPADVAVEDLVREFGDDVLADGRTVRDIARVLPAGGRFASLDALVDEVSEREAAIVRTTVGADAAVGAALGLEGGVTEIASADVERLEAIPSRARVALARNGIESVGALAEAKPEAIAAILEAEGVRAGVADSAGWTRLARTLTRLR